ncbi:RagB/SusD family nutrient uptake outer membrane protein [Prevotella sp. 10(H)]|uniref:RagB/SusD family nutrient uptake outer membrane protein n=1 Tax=Prevotella sp. 10(H) TaxID=1158294 RepID=UPI0004A71458|nr:RagB/SusD family nutrient uptake outer membrane protein [Prevotella sp. 10(H)]
MKILIRSIIAIIISSAAIFSSCESYLDVDNYFDDQMKFDSIFQSKRNLQRYMWGIAESFPDEGEIFGYERTPGVTATDEIFTLMTDDIFRGKAFTLGKVTADDTKSMGVWGDMYKKIRKANLILARMDECKDLTALDRREILAYTHFIRAYAYYQLFMAYGPVIIVGDEVFPTNEEPEAYNRGRNTFDETVDYICNEFENAAQYLQKEVPMSLYGRPTQGAAYALIARVRLQAASPAFNGGDMARKYFGNWKRSEDGEYYVSMNYDERKWALAAAAAKRVMDMTLYKLHTVDSDENTPKLPANVPSAKFPDGAGEIDPYKSYSQLFNGESFPQRNPELIWSRMSGQVRDFTRQSFPVYMGGYNGMGLTQKVVDAYRMVDGKTIQEAEAVGEYSEEGFTNERKSFSGYELNNNVFKMYENREMRFYACVGFSECFWPATSTSDNSVKNQTVTYYVDARGGKNGTNADPNNYTPTGYVLKKYVHPDDAWTGDGNQRMDKAFPIIRYAEILLSYAEALNNLTTTHTVEMSSGETYTVSRDKDEMAKAFNQVRFRAGLPGLTNSQLESVPEMFNQIVNERFIELLCEGRRFYDLRRWGIYEEEDSKPISGMNAEAKRDEGFYTRTVMSQYADYRNRVVDKKMLFLPINRNEIRKVPKLDQNQGYGD